EYLVHEQNRTVMLVSTIDPLHNANGDHTESEPQTADAGRTENGSDIMFRWAALLSSFVRCEFITKGAEEDGEFCQTVKELRRRVSSKDKAHDGKIVDSFKQECSPTPRLRIIGKELINR